MSNFFDDLGIHVADIVAGAVGGIARILMPPFMGAWSSLATVLLGTCTAAYFTEPAMSLIGEKISRGAVGFVIGLGAMVVCQGILGAVGKVSENMKIPGGRKDA